MRTYVVRQEPRYIPRVGHVIMIQLRDVSRNEIPTRVLYSEGSVRTGKIRLYCQSGEKAEPVHLIWKETTGWICWIGPKRFTNVSVDPSA